MKRTLLALSLLTLGSTAVAEEAKKLTTDIELGVVSTTGNTETTSLKGKVDIQQELESFRNQFILSGFYTKDQVEVEEDDVTITEDQTTAEKYLASAQSDYKLNEEHRGLFVYGSYETDRFSSYEYQGALALGYSDRLFQFDNSLLTYSIGPGVSFAETREVLDEDGEVETESESETNAIIRIAFEYLYQISETAKFTQTVSSDVAVEQGKNTKSNAETALTANIKNGLALKASYVIDHNTHVADDTKHADTTTSITLVLSF